jgi:SOS response regulatory protein OraA/RecX
MNDSKSSPRSAWDQALVRLNVREYGVTEMAQYLTRKGYDSGEIEQTMKELMARGLLSDERYAAVLARHVIARGKGPSYLQARLRQKGVRLTASQAKSLFQNFSSHSEIDLAMRILETRYPRANQDLKQKQRAFSGLIRRGISPDVAREALRKLR